MTDRYTAGRLGLAARRRRTAHLQNLRSVAVADMDVIRARQALSEAEVALSAARVVAGLNHAA